jgi:hypothetical protein
VGLPSIAEIVVFLAAVVVAVAVVVVVVVDVDVEELAVRKETRNQP